MRLKSLLYFLGVFLITSCNQLREAKTLTLAHGLPISHPVHKGILVLKKSVEEQSNGALQIKIYPDGQLGSERESLELLQIGSLAMTKVSAATISNFVPDYSVLSIPYLFKDKAHYFKTLEGEVGQGLLAKGADYWLKGLCFYDAGSRSFYTKKNQIKTPSDLSGLKIRVMNDPTAIKMVTALGGSPTPMSFGELYTALQQGVVDGAENNPPSFVTSRHFEICKYYTIDSHSYVPDVLIIGTKTLSTLTSEEKTWLKKAVKISTKAQREFWKQSVNESLDILKKEGVSIHYPNTKLFSKQTESVINSFNEPSKRQLIQKIISIQ